jgi:hypothetical protein
VKMQWYVLVSPALLLASGSLLAAPVSDIERFQQDDGALNLYLRSVQIDVNSRNDLVENTFGGFPDGNKLGAHAIGAILDYNSPYLMNTIGFDASYYAVGKIDSEDNSMGLLQDDEERKGFSKLGQAYAKAKLQYGGVTVHGQIGRGRFESATVKTRDTRVAPDSYSGARAEFDVDSFTMFGFDSKFEFDAVRITGASLRDEKQFSSLESLSGEKINHVTSLGMALDAKLLKIKLGYGVAQNFNENKIFDITLRAPLPGESGMLVNYQYHKSEANGDVWEKDLLAGKSPFEKESNFRNLNVGYKNGAFRAGVSLAKTSADSGQVTPFGTKAVGHSYFDHGRNVIGSNDPWTITGNDFNNDGELTKQIAVEFDMNKTNITSNPLDGITFLVIHKVGEFDATNPIPMLTGGVPVSERVVEKQTEYRAYYRFDEKDYSGVTAGLSYTDYEINKDFVSLVSKQPSNVVSGNELRVYIDYAF